MRLDCGWKISISITSSSFLNLEAFCNSDWGSTLDLNDMLRSNTGMFVMLGCSLVQALKQTKGRVTFKCRGWAPCYCWHCLWTIMAHTFAIQTIISPNSPLLLLSDNQAALDIAVDPIFRPKTKYFTLDCHFVHDRFILILSNHFIFQALVNNGDYLKMRRWF